MDEKWWSSMLKGGCEWVTNTSCTKFCISTKGWLGTRWSGGKKHDISGVGKERYTSLCAGYEGSKRNGTRPLRASFCYVVLCKVKLVGTRISR